MTACLLHDSYTAHPLTAEPMRTLTLATLCILIASMPASAQQTTHAFFGELGGSAFGISANYELSLGPVALRTGGGYMPFLGLVLPTTAALRLGRRGRLEIGGGILSAPLAPASASRNWPPQFIPVGAVSGLLAYRWNVPRGSPTPSHFARVAFTPLFSLDGVVVPWVGVAVGIPASKQ